MSEPPESNPPVTRTPDAVRAITAALHAVLKRRNIPQLNLLGWSWGTTIMGAYTSRNSPKVHRLVLYAPQWLRTQGRSPTDAGGQLGAYRVVTEDGVRKRRVKRTETEQ